MIKIVLFSVKVSLNNWNFEVKVIRLLDLIMLPTFARSVGYIVWAGSKPKYSIYYYGTKIILKIIFVIKQFKKFVCSLLYQLYVPNMASKS